MTLSQDQQVSLVTTILGANLTVAAIFFGVLGFIYAVFVNFAPPKLPNEPVKEMRVPLLTHPILVPLTQIARLILIGLGLSVFVAGGCFVWFSYQAEKLLIAIIVGLLFEVLLLFGIGARIVFSLMPSSSQN